MKIRRFAPYIVIALVYATLFLGYRTLVPALERGYRWAGPEARRFASLRNELRMNAEALRDVMLRDSILPLIPARPGLAIMLPDSGGDRIEYLRRVAEREVPAGTDVAIPVMGVSVDYANFSEIPDAFSSRRYYAGDRAAAAPYCAIVVPYMMAEPVFSTRHGSLLGPCRLWARHGSAGPHVAEWMRDTRGQFAHEAQWFDDEYDGLPFSGWFGSHFWGSFDGRRCRAGDAGACADALLREDTSIVGSSLSQRDFYMPRIAPGEARLLADMEREFGPERFQRFWQSPQPVEQAFEAAFGIALGEWIVGWSEARYGPLTIGSRMKLETILLSLLFIGLFTGLAIATVRGRRIR